MDFNIYMYLLLFIYKYIRIKKINDINIKITILLTYTPFISFTLLQSIQLYDISLLFIIY